MRDRGSGIGDRGSVRGQTAPEVARAPGARRSPLTLHVLRFTFAASLTLLLPTLAAPLPVPAQSDHGFRFVRIKFDTESSGWMGRMGGDVWAHDYPTAEHNFYEALERTTLIHIEAPPLVLELSDARIFEHPILYLCEPGYWAMSEEDAENLRAYLQRGGFILFDDFRGEQEWRSFVEQMARVLPDAAPVELPPEHPVWSIYYDVDPVATPSLVSGFGRRGGGGYEARYVGFFDGDGRLVALACHNQDLGDGWEWPDRNFENASLATFQMGVNFLIYALTH